MKTFVRECVGTDQANICLGGVTTVLRVVKAVGRESVTAVMASVVGLKFDKIVASRSLSEPQCM